MISISRWMRVFHYQLAGCLAEILNMWFGRDPINFIFHLIEIYRSLIRKKMKNWEFDSMNGILKQKTRWARTLGPYFWSKMKYCNLIERSTYRSRPFQLQVLVACIQKPNRSNFQDSTTHTQTLVQVDVLVQIRVPTLWPMGASQHRLQLSLSALYREESDSSSETFLAWWRILRARRIDVSDKMWNTKILMFIHSPRKICSTKITWNQFFNVAWWCITTFPTFL